MTKKLAADHFEDILEMITNVYMKVSFCVHMSIHVYMKAKF